MKNSRNFSYQSFDLNPRNVNHPRRFSRYSFRGTEFSIVCYLFSNFSFFFQVRKSPDWIWLPSGVQTAHSDQVSLRRSSKRGWKIQPQSSFLSYRNSFWSAKKATDRLRCVRIEPRSRLPRLLLTSRVYRRQYQAVLASKQTSPLGRVKFEERRSRTGYSRWMITRQCDLLPEDPMDQPRYKNRLILSIR